MSRTFWTAAAVIAVVVYADLRDSDLLSAAGPRTYLRILGVTTVTTPDGIRLKQASNATVTTLEGQAVGTARVTSFEAHPGLEYLPTIIEVTAGGVTAIIGGLQSTDGRFRQTLGYTSEGALLSFYNSNYVRTSDTEYLAFLEQGPTPTNETVPSPTLQHGFIFTQDRVDRRIGDTGLSFRPGNQWYLSPSFGQLLRAGDNPSISIASLTAPPQQYSLNFLRLPDQQSGSMVVCFGAAITCGLKGVGDFAGFFGRAFSLSIGSLGVNVNAASETVLTHRDSSVPPNAPGCPAILPPPQSVVAVDDLYEIQIGGTLELEHRFAIAWDSVECATGYVIRTFNADGTSDQTTVSEPFFNAVGGAGTSRYFQAVAVAAIGPNGVVGVFSERVDFVPM